MHFFPLRPHFPSKKNYSEKGIFLFKLRQCKTPLCINSDANPLFFKSNFFILHSFHGVWILDVIQWLLLSNFLIFKSTPFSFLKQT